MSPLARSLLALAIAAMLHGACAFPTEEGDQCTTEVVGHESPFPVLLESVVIPSGQRQATIDVHWTMFECPLFHLPVGAAVAACDDVAPTVVIQDSHILVSRNGIYCDRTATVDVTVYCSPRPHSQS